MQVWMLNVITATNFADLIQDFCQTTIPIQKASARSQDVAPDGTDIAPKKALVSKEEAEDLELDEVFEEPVLKIQKMESRLFCSRGSSFGSV